jgi:hypothetical protein
MDASLFAKACPVLLLLLYFRPPWFFNCYQWQKCPLLSPSCLQVLDYLEKRLLSGGSSSSPEQHIARLQEESRVSLQVLRKTISSLSNRDAKDKDKQELPLELQLCKQQLGDTHVSGLGCSAVGRGTVRASLV